MKKLLTTIMALALFSVAWGAETEPLFKGNELSLGLSSSVRLNHDYDVNLSAGAQYYITKNLGFEATIPVYQTAGISVDNVEFGGLFRVPVGIVAFYGGAGAKYSWKGSEQWDGYFKMGVEARIFRGWGLFAESSYIYPEFGSSFTKGDFLVGGGVRLKLF